MTRVQASSRGLRVALGVALLAVLTGPIVAAHARNSAELRRLRARVAEHRAHDGSRLLGEQAAVGHFAGTSASCDFLVLQLRCLDGDRNPSEMYLLASVEGVRRASLRKAGGVDFRALALPGEAPRDRVGSRVSGERMVIKRWDGRSWSPYWDEVFGVPWPVDDLATVTRGAECARPYLVMVLDAGHEGRLDPRCW